MLVTDTLAPSTPAVGRVLLDNVNLAGSGLNNLRVALMTQDHGAGMTPVLEDSATAQLHRGVDEGGDELPSRIVLVLVESWGLFHDASLNDLQLGPLREVLDQHANPDVQYGTVRFQGSTVAAELRELCMRNVTSTHPDVSSFSMSCLPELLKSGGYSTKAVHGFSSALFSRNSWYPQLGFEQVFFAPDLMREGMTSRCGFVFPGICDTAIWDWLVGGLLQSDKRQFIYWLTLSGHLPLPADPNWLTNNEPRCPAGIEEQGREAVCDLIRVHQDLFSVIAKHIEQGVLDDTWLIIVGDHAPPFLEPQLRAMFDDREVPFVAVRFPSAD